MFRFPWGDMHSLNLGWFLQKFNELRADWATAEENITGALDAEIQRAEDALSDVFDARDAAAASATAAAGSASAAGTSATAAQNSATGAANSATLANNKATAAGLSEAAAAQSATQAGNSATAAAGSATAAGQSATNAGSSATAAAASETAAGNSATAAAGSATAAQTSENNAAASAAEAQDILDSIPDDYSDFQNVIYEQYPTIYSPLSAFAKGSISAFIQNRNIIERSAATPSAQLYALTGENMIAVTDLASIPDNAYTIFLPVGNYVLKFTCLEDSESTGQSGLADFIRVRIKETGEISDYCRIEHTLTRGNIASINLAITNAPAHCAIAIYRGTTSTKNKGILEISKVSNQTLGLILENR